MCSVIYATAILVVVAVAAPGGRDVEEAGDALRGTLQRHVVGRVSDVLLLHAGIPVPRLVSPTRTQLRLLFATKACA